MFHGAPIWSPRSEADEGSSGVSGSGFRALRAAELVIVAQGVRQATRRRFLRISRHPGFIVGSLLTLGFFLLGVLGPLLAPYDPLSPDPARMLEGPSRSHFLGLDELGRDVLSRLLWGARASLLMGVVPAVTGMLIGVLVGYATSRSRSLDDVTMAVVDVLLAFPATVLAIAIVAVLGPSLVNTIIVLSIVAAPRFARIMRSSVLSVRSHEYVEAARAFGASHARIYGRHVLPNSLSPLLVQGSVHVGSAILQGAGLSFLGLGVQAPAPEWGSMIGTARSYIFQAPMLSLYPGVVLALVVLGINLLGDALRDLLDPTTHV